MSKSYLKIPQTCERIIQSRYPEAHQHSSAYSRPLGLVII